MGQDNGWPKNGWLLIEPECVGDGTGDNVHIMPVKFTGCTKDNKVQWDAPARKTIDGCSKEITRPIKLAKSAAYYDTEAGRKKIIAANNELHDEGKNVCANCWKHLNADEEENKENGQ